MSTFPGMHTFAVEVKDKPAGRKRGTWRQVYVTRAFDSRQAVKKARNFGYADEFQQVRAVRVAGAEAQPNA